jgi:hypothetical protein
MDTFLFMEKVEHCDTDVSFKLQFRKARERTPETRADFAEISVALIENAWTYTCAEAAAPSSKVSPAAGKFLSALVNVLAGDDAIVREGRRCSTMESWRRECTSLGLIDREAKEHSARTLFAKYRRELVTANRIACSNEFAWTLT